MIGFQIEILRCRFDDMQNAEKKSGTVSYLEPLAMELNDCFNALKGVKPDALFGTHSGLKVIPDDIIEVEEDEEKGDQAEATTSHEKSEATPKKKQTPKCEIYFNMLTVNICSKIELLCNKSNSNI